MPTQNFNFSPSWFEQPLQDLNSCGCAGAVGTQETEALAHPDFEIESVDCFNPIIVTLVKVSATNCQSHECHLITGTRSEIRPKNRRCQDSKDLTRPRATTKNGPPRWGDTEKPWDADSC